MALSPPRRPWLGSYFRSCDHGCASCFADGIVADGMICPLEHGNVNYSTPTAIYTTSDCQPAHYFITHRSFSSVHSDSIKTEAAPSPGSYLWVLGSPENCWAPRDQTDRDLPRTNGVSVALAYGTCVTL